MSFKAIEVKLTDEVHALVKKMAERGRGKGRGERKPCTIGEMAADLVSTGAFRRIAANKWAKEHAAPKKERKPKAAKKPATKKVKASKPKTAKKSSSKKPATKKAKKSSAPASSSAAAPAAPSVLD